jgi:hypothetical protein
MSKARAPDPAKARPRSMKARVGLRELETDLSTGSGKAVFKWLIAGQVFGERISQEVAAEASNELDQAGCTSANVGGRRPAGGRVGPRAVEIFVRELKGVWILGACQHTNI